jgi:DNA-binding transcriptional LysR family regulator
MTGESRPRPVIDFSYGGSAEFLKSKQGASNREWRMKLHQLEIFECVSRHLNFTSAASELHISQPAVSSQLKLLEEEYGTPFYKRTNHGVEMTEKGEAFLRAVRPILLQIQKLQSDFKTRDKSKRASSLAVATNNTLSATIMPRAIAAFRQRHPKVKLLLEIMHSDAIERRILESEIEVALITRPSHSENFIYEPYEEHETAAFVHNDSAVSGRRMTLGELTRHPLVVKTGCPCVRELKKRGLELTIALECNAREAVKMAVKRGLGIGMLFNPPKDSDLAKDGMRLINVPELKKLKHNSFLVYGRHSKLSSVGRDFVEILQEIRTPAVSSRH